MNFYQVITFFMCNRIRPFLSELLRLWWFCCFVAVNTTQEETKTTCWAKLSRASIKIVPSVMGPKCFRPATKWAAVTSSNYGQPTTTPKPPKTNVCCICETLKIRVVLSKSITESLYWGFSPAFALSGFCLFLCFLFAFSYFRSRVKLLLVRTKHFLVLVKGHKKEGSVITSVRLWWQIYWSQRSIHGGKH